MNSRLCRFTAVGRKPSPALPSLLVVCLTVVTADLAEAQQPAAQAPTAQPSARPQRPTPQPMQLDARLEQVLKVWESRSSQVKRLQGEHVRYVYQMAVGLELRATGEFFFDSPDKGRIDIEPMEVVAGQMGVTMNDKNELVGRKQDPRGNLLRVKSADPEKWICDGEQILGLSEALGDKQYSRIQIPPQMRGENVMDGPLPFLFGVSAEKLKARYRLQLGQLHSWNPQAQDGNFGTVHVIAYPTRKADAQNWQQAQVLLDGQYFLPRAISFKDGLGPYATETVYKFNDQRMAANQKWRAKGMRALMPIEIDPFKPNLKGWKLLEDHRIGQTDARAQGR